MKVIELNGAEPSLNEIVGMAKEQAVVLRQPDGSLFMVSEIDDLSIESGLLRNDPNFISLLKQLSQEKPAISIESLREELGV